MSDEIWWLIIKTPDGVFAWPVGDEDASRDPALLNAARLLTGYPADDNAQTWKTAGCDLQVTPGTPHPKLLAVATVGTVDELRAVKQSEVDAYATGRLEAARSERIEVARAALAVLDDEAKAEAIGTAATVLPDRGGTDGPME